MMNDSRAGTAHAFTKSLFPVALMEIVEVFCSGGERWRSNRRTAAV